MENTAQRELIKAELLQGKTVTPISALNKFGCFRLSARIFELREQGLKIECKRQGEKGFAVYFIDEKTEQQ